MNTNETHLGQNIKNILNEYRLSDKTITSLTPFNQSFLSKLYTSREIQPRNLMNFLHVINRIFNLNLTVNDIYNRNLIEA